MTTVLHYLFLYLFVGAVFTFGSVTEYQNQGHGVSVREFLGLLSVGTVLWPLGVIVIWLDIR